MRRSERKRTFVIHYSQGQFVPCVSLRYRLPLVAEIT